MSEAHSDVQLSDVVAAVVADVRHGPQGFALDDDQLAAHANTLSLPHSDIERRHIAAELLAVLMKYERAALAHTVIARAQLLVLLGIVAGELAAQLMADRGITADKKTLDAVGAQASKLPAGAGGRVAGAFSPLGLRLGRPNTSK